MPKFAYHENYFSPKCIIFTLLFVNDIKHTDQTFMNHFIEILWLLIYQYNNQLNKYVKSSSNHPTANVWWQCCHSLTWNLPGLVVPAGGITSTGIVLRVREAHKPPHHDKVATTGEVILCVCVLFILLFKNIYFIHFIIHPFVCFFVLAITISVWTLWQSVYRLGDHRWIHTREKPHQCETCDRALWLEYKT